MTTEKATQPMPRRAKYILLLFVFPMVAMSLASIDGEDSFVGNHALLSEELFGIISFVIGAIIIFKQEMGRR